MKALKQLAVTVVSLGLVACNSIDSETAEKAANPSILFADSMAADWQANWFLDGQNASLEHRDNGLSFITTASQVDKRVDRAAFDAQHAVFWTKESFAGDIRIRYTYTRLPGCSWQKLIYIQAQGIEEGPYVEDIYAWRDRREVAVMSQYFNHMDLIALSLRDQVRCKRYPWNDFAGNDIEDEFRPRAENAGVTNGHELDVLVEKRKRSLYLKITDNETGETVVDHTWDLAEKRVTDDHDPKFVTEGRIGIRQMGGHKMLMRDFSVERL